MGGSHAWAQRIYLLQRHKQLVKSNDDLRQDAVMQQYFALVNHLLASDAASATRRLRMATYHAVAFSGDCGLVQWVTNTISLNDYLTGGAANGAGGAHERYRRAGELSSGDCYTALSTAHREPGKRGVRAAYDRVAARFPPVLRHFFTERYTSAMLWCVPSSSAQRGAIPRMQRVQRACFDDCLHSEHSTRSMQAGEAAGVWPQRGGRVDRGVHYWPRRPARQQRAAGRCHRRGAAHRPRYRL